MSAEAWELVRYLHVLGMAFFVGGQLVIAAALVPVERANPDPERMRAVARRFGWGSMVALLVLIATGVAMAADSDRWADGTLQLKLGLVGLIFGLTTAHLLWPRHRIVQVLILLTSLAVVWLGLDLAH